MFAKILLQEKGKKHTARNFFKSFPDAVSWIDARALLTSILKAEAMPTTIFSGISTSGIRGGALVM